MKSTIFIKFLSKDSDTLYFLDDVCKSLSITRIIVLERESDLIERLASFTSMTLRKNIKVELSGEESDILAACSMLQDIMDPELQWDYLFKAKRGDDKWKLYTSFSEVNKWGYLWA